MKIKFEVEIDTENQADCDKMQASEIAKFLGIQVNTANVRISQIKKEAIDKLIANVSPSQVVDYL